MTKFLIPLKRNDDLKALVNERATGTLEYPQTLKPKFSPNILCQHGNQFDPNDVKMFKVCDKIKVINESSEQIFDITVQARKTIADCKCEQQPNTPLLLLWNLGNGKLIDYTYLGSAAQQFCCGLNLSVLVNAGLRSFKGNGFSSDLGQHDFNRAFTGFSG